MRAERQVLAASLAVSEACQRSDLGLQSQDWRESLGLLTALEWIAKSEELPSLWSPWKATEGRCVCESTCFP